MIGVHGYRINSGHRYDDYPPYREDSVVGALGSLMLFEIGYGGKVVAINQTKIITETRIFSCVDTMIFEGEEREMEPLLRGVYYAVQAQHEEGFTDSSVDYQIRLLGEEIKGVPFYVAMTYPFVVGRVARPAMMLALGYAEEEDIRAAMHLRTEDMVPALELHRDNPEISFRDLVDVYGFPPRKNAFI